MASASTDGFLIRWKRECLKLLLAGVVMVILLTIWPMEDMPTLTEEEVLWVSAVLILFAFLILAPLLAWFHLIVDRVSEKLKTKYPAQPATAKQTILSLFVNGGFGLVLAHMIGTYGEWAPILYLAKGLKIVAILAIILSILTGIMRFFVGRKYEEKRPR